MGANYLFKSIDRGDTWQTLGGDLTRNIDRNKLPMRGAVPSDTGVLGRNEGTAEFSNITMIDESPLKKGLLALGTNDGLIQVSRDDGKTWTEVDHVSKNKDGFIDRNVTPFTARHVRILSDKGGSKSGDTTFRVFEFELRAEEKK